MTTTIESTDWTLVPSTIGEIATVRKKCRRLVLQRAAVSAGIAVVPIPGADIATDLGMLAGLIEQINAEFGLTPAQIERLQPTLRLAVYEMTVSMGAMLVGKVVTRELVTRLLKRIGIKILVKHSAKFVPLAGQFASATIGFAAFRTIGYQHIDACTHIATELLAVDAKPAT
jgi:uncharacterized protein (DUF697 family)